MPFCLAGIDYLSVAAYVDIVAAHRVLLGKVRSFA